jgi:SulP family sulfate permease
MLPGALTITLLGLMEAMSIAKAMAVRTRQRINVNQELIGQGIGNLAGCLTHSYVVSGSFSRSAVNLNAGAVTGMSSVVTSIVVAVTLIWFTPLLYHLPQATLAAVILTAVITLIRVQPIRFAFRTYPFDGFIAVVTFVLTLVLAPHLHYAIGTGIALSIIGYLYRTMRPQTPVLSRHADGTLRDADMHQLPHCKHIAVIRFDAGLYFINSGYFEDRVLELVADMPDLRCLIVDAGGINRVDSTGEAMLFTLVERLKDQGIVLCFSRVKTGLMHAFDKTGFAELVGRENFFRWNQHAVEHAWRMTGCDHERDCPLYTDTPRVNYESDAYHAPSTRHP